jgi:hypothetical protein
MSNRLRRTERSSCSPGKQLLTRLKNAEYVGIIRKRLNSKRFSFNNFTSLALLCMKGFKLTEARRYLRVEDSPASVSTWRSVASSVEIWELTGFKHFLPVHAPNVNEPSLMLTHTARSSTARRCDAMFLYPQLRLADKTARGKQETFATNSGENCWGNNDRSSWRLKQVTKRTVFMFFNSWEVIFKVFF